MKIGTHNLHDVARPTFFADVVLFTEAAHAARSARRAHALGFELLTCAHQPDLVIAYRRSMFTPEAVEYRRAHEGDEKVTPHRGTFVATGELRGGHPAALLVEHRINAAFPPYIRGEAELRAFNWHTHTDLTLSWIDELHAARYGVIAGGDTNVHRRPVYGGRLREVGRGFDRLAVSGRLGRLTDLRNLGHEGSDHPRIRASLEAHCH